MRLKGVFAAWATTAVLAAAVVACREKPLRVQEADVSVSPAELEFGDVPVGSSSVRAFSIENRSRYELDASIQVPAPFRGSDRIRLPATGKVDVQVSFAPEAVGTARAELAVHIEQLRVPLSLRAQAVLPGACGQTGPCQRLVAGDGCALAPLPDGTSCEHPCLTHGTCVGGACLGTEVSCDDGDACTLDTCDERTGCSNSPRTCADPGDPCRAAACDPVTGCHEVDVADGTRCGPNDCVTARICIAGSCVERASVEGSECGEPSPCQATGVCRDSSCQRPAPVPLRKLWSFHEKAQYSDTRVAGVDEQGRLFVVEAEGNGSDRPFVSRLTALDARTGTLLFEIPLPGRVISPFHVSRGRIYLSVFNELLAIDSSTGAVVWSSDLYGPLRPQLEPFRGPYPLYGVRLEGIVERQPGDLRVLLSGEALDQYGHVVWIGVWWVQLDLSSGAILASTRLEEGSSDYPVLAESGSVYFSTAHRIAAGHWESRLVEIRTTGSHRVIEASTNQSYRLTAVRAGRVMALRHAFSTDAAHVFWPSPSGRGVVVMAKTGANTTMTDAVLGDSIGFARGQSGNSKPLLIAFDVDTGATLGTVEASPLPGYDHLSRLLLTREEQVVFSGKTSSYANTDVELRGFSAQGPRFTCLMESVTPYGDAYMLPGIWIGLTSMGIDAFEAPGLEPF